MAAVDAIVAIACEVKPDEATLVPEKRQELTTEGGLDVVAHEAAVGAVVERLQAAGIEVSLFIDPDPRQVEAAQRLGGRRRRVPDRPATPRRARRRSRRPRAGRPARAPPTAAAALRPARPHGPRAELLQRQAGRRASPGVEELNIGHSIVSRAVLVGMERAVREMKEAIRQGSRQ